MRRLVLFDIDGTLLSSNGVAPKAFRAALEEVFGTSGPRDGYSFAGRTDLQIARDLLKMAGLEGEEVERGIPKVFEIYLEQLAVGFRGATASLLPGVRPLLDRLHSSTADALLGLLTGNVLEGARMKIESAGLHFDRFRVGAYGSDHADRRELPALAVERAERAFGRLFQGKEVVIIGDTPMDIACGEHLGVRTIAVATGSYTLEELQQCSPDHAFPSLEDGDRVWEAIFS